MWGHNGALQQASAYENEAWFGSNFIGPGPNADPYTIINLSSAEGEYLQPVDALDEAAQRHDYAYWKSRASGVSGALFNLDVTDADTQLATDAARIVGGYFNNEIDEVTKKPISFRTAFNAFKVYEAFRNISVVKQTRRGVCGH